MSSNLDADFAALRRIRRTALRRLKKLVNSIARPSGYVTNLRPDPNGSGLISDTVMLFCRKDKKPMNIKGSSFDEIVAISTEGVSDDAYGHGMVLVPWKNVSIDDLLRLEKYILKNRGELE